MQKPNEIKDKSYRFAVAVSRLYKELQGQNEFVLSRNLVKAGTGIGANVEEATAAQNRKDYMARMSKAFKDAKETRYWLRLLADSKICDKIDFAATLKNAEELVSLLAAILKTGKPEAQGSGHRAQ